MNKRHLLLPLIPALSAAALVATPALAASPEGVSENWAGYEVSPNGSTGFSNVQGSWIQPSAKCTDGTATYSAFWVGIGGGGQSSQALEQTGTQADCSANGQASYFAWYELVPSAPVRLGLQVHPGDKISAAVRVSGSSVRVTLLDNTTGAYANKTLQMSNPDTSTAEWIAEAPSNCQGGADGQCTPLPLADFGSVAFTGASATAGGHTGSISDSDWTDEPLALDSSQDGLGGGDGFGFADTNSTSSGSSAGAQPSGLSNNGSSFSVAYDANGPGESVSSESSGGGGYGGGSGSSSSTGDGYGYGGGSGYGDPSGYGDGYGDGYGYGNGYGYGGDGYSGGGYGYGGDSGYSSGDGTGFVISF